jgi:hypothetical protein
MNDKELLEAALAGLELQRQKIEDQIQTVRSRLGIGVKRRGRPPGSGANAARKRDHQPRKRVLTEAARKRIAAAQKRRWAEYRKASGPKAE